MDASTVVGAVSVVGSVVVVVVGAVGVFDIVDDALSDR